MARSDARLSIYSGAPSLQPSLAPTFDTTSHRSNSHSQQGNGSHLSEQPLSSISADNRNDHYSNRTNNNNNYSDPRQRNVGRVIYPGQSTHPTMYSNADASSGGSSWTLASNDPRTADIRSFAHVLDKMTDARFDKQRYVMSGHKTEEVSKIALGAKLDRALSRRMVGQDAIFRTAATTTATKKKSQPTLIDEKRALEVQAA